MKRRSILLAGVLIGTVGAFMSGCVTHPKPVVAVYEPPEAGHYTSKLVSPGTKFAALPPAVQHTIRAETGGAEIEDILRDTIGAQQVYRVYFGKAGFFPPLYVASDGTVLNPDLTVAVGAGQDYAGIVTGSGAGVTLGDLPPKAIEAIQQRAPQAEIKSIIRENRGEQAVYIVSFKDQKQPILEVTSEGNILIPAAPIRIPDHRRQ